MNQSLPFPESTPETGTEYSPKLGFVFAYNFSPVSGEHSGNRNRMPSKTGFCFRIHFLSRFRRALRKPEQNALQNLVLFSPTFFTGRIGCHQIGLSTNWGRSFAFCLIRNEPISRLRRALRKPEQYIPLFVIIFVFAFTLSSGSGSLPFPESTPETGRIGRLQIGLSTNWDLSFAFCLIRNESISRFRRALRKPEQNTLQKLVLFSPTISLPFPESTPETGTEYPPKLVFVFAYIFSPVSGEHSGNRNRIPSKTWFCFRLHFLTGRIGCLQIGLSTNWGLSFASVDS